MPMRQERWAALATLMMLYVTTGLCWWISTPLGQSPDEFVHADYPSFIIQHGRLPSLGHDMCSRAMSDVRWFTAVSYTHLTLPTIYSV